jgi:nondiscriminating glutamyl-tRNA synthetase
MTDTVRVRFAPSPTGLLHIGNARTALFNCIFARHHGGTFVLRIEDTDVERSTEESAGRIIDDLHWLGLEWDEGPDRNGSHGPYRQSQRHLLYSDYAERLLREERAYKCFCSPERLDALRKEQMSKGTMPRYDGRCRSLTGEEISRMESSGGRPAIRFRVGKGSIPFHDLIHGKMNFEAEGIGDFIIMRSDGMAAYNFACVIDDHLMEITHVIRGEDHLSNTPRQIQIYRTLGWQPPQFGHHTLILGPDRSPLSKRHGSTTVSQYREEGFLPEALLNYLVLLGWTPPSGEEILPFDGIVRDFSIASVSRSAPIFNRKKLEWLNSHYIRRMDDESLFRAATPYIEKAGLAIDQVDREYLLHVVTILKENLTVLSQVQEYLGIFFHQQFRFDEEAEKILRDPGNRAALQTALEVFKECPDVTAEGWGTLHSVLEERTGRKGKALYAPLRAALTGKLKGPELARTLPLLGKERILKRLEMALEIKEEILE